MTTAQAELARNFAALKSQPTPPYYLSYEIFDSRQVTVTGAFGALQHSDASHRRVAHVDVRVGDYALDNTHQVRGAISLEDRLSSVALPVDDDAIALRSALWIDTDRRYKRALQQLAAVQTR